MGERGEKSSGKMVVWSGRKNGASVEREGENWEQKNAGREEGKAEGVGGTTATVTGLPRVTD